MTANRNSIQRVLSLSLLFTVTFFSLELAVSLAAGPVAAGSGPIQIQADQQVYEPFSGKSDLIQNVKVAIGDTQVTGSQAHIDSDASGKASSAEFINRATMVRRKADTQQTVQADHLKMGLQNDNFQADGKVSTQINGDAKSGGHVTIQADKQEFDQEKHLMRAVGHVTVNKEDLSANSPEALVFMGDNGSAQKVIFINGAHMKNGDQEMTADTLTINLNTDDVYADKNAKSSVKSKDSQGKPTTVKVSSNLLEFDKKTGTLIASGHTVVHYDDYLASGPKATFVKVNNELDHINMTGRATIDDQQRRVTGDTVIITINPKQFTAKGNVNTFIKASQKGGSSSSADTAAPANGSAAVNSSGVRAKGKKNVSDKAKAKSAATAKSAQSAPAVQSPSTPTAPPSAQEQELMIEKETQQSK